MPGVRKSIYDPSKPGIRVTALNSAPNRTNQISGWVRVMPMYAGFRTKTLIPAP